MAGLAHACAACKGVSSLCIINGVADSGTHKADLEV